MVGTVATDHRQAEFQSIDKKSSGAMSLRKRAMRKNGIIQQQQKTSESRMIDEFPPALLPFYSRAGRLKRGSLRLLPLLVVWAASAASLFVVERSNKGGERGVTTAWCPTTPPKRAPISMIQSPFVKG